MNKPIVFSALYSLKGPKIEDKSDRFINRLLVTFENGFKVSAVKGKDCHYGRDFGTYSGPNTVEVAVFDKDGEFILTNDVEGWVTPPELEKLLDYVGKLPAGINIKIDFEPFRIKEIREV